MIKIFILIQFLIAIGLSAQELDQEAFINEALLSHNQYRLLHGAQPLKINNELNKIAFNRASHMAANFKLFAEKTKLNNDDLGEIVGLVKGFKNFNGISATVEWYSAIAKFDKFGEESKEGASFTQMIWQSTTDVGFGIAKDSNGAFYFVAEYWPKGNIKGQYQNNVFQLSLKKINCPTQTKPRTLIPTVDDFQALSRLLSTDEVKANLNNIIQSFGNNLLNTLQTSIKFVKDANLFKKENINKAEQTFNNLVASLNDTSKSNRRDLNQNVQPNIRNPTLIQTKNNPTIENKVIEVKNIQNTLNSLKTESKDNQINSQKEITNQPNVVQNNGATSQRIVGPIKFF